MGLILTVISGAGALVGAAVVKVIADDAKEWTPWVTRRLLDIAVRRLPEGQRERYAEEWAGHLADVPGVVGKLVVALQFQIAAFGARELDARAQLDAWRNKRDADLLAFAEFLEWHAAATGQLPARADARKQLSLIVVMTTATTEIMRRYHEVGAEQPRLGVTTVSGAIFLAGHFFDLRRRRNNRRLRLAMRRLSLADRKLIAAMRIIAATIYPPA